MANPCTVWPALRWVLRLALTLGAATFVTGAAPSSELTTQLVSALDTAADEEAAKLVVEPYLGDLKQLDSKVVEKVVLRQFWGLANVLVAKSHEQQVDLSFAVRKAVRSLKDEADELLRTLNPKYGQAQQVAPAFQWAQNDTCIFLTVKFTIRWNAPGALEVTDTAVIMRGNTFNFTGLGKHSNNKYKYVLALSLFDNLAPAASTWSVASVGKLSVTLKKQWARKWPRLLANKKTKIGNMHVWMDNQEKLDASLGGLATVSNSPITCAANDKLYCLATDTCKKSANCSQCPGKTIAMEEHHMCTGMPTEKASLSYKDTDMDEHEIGGPIQISKARNEFDIDHYVAFWGKDDQRKLELDNGQPGMLIGKAVPTGSDTEIMLKQNTKIPDQATHILVFSKNAYGEYPTPGQVIVKDAYLPREKPKKIVFEDEDGEKGEVSGTITVTRASDEKTIDEYSLHWGKSASRKIASASFLRDIPKGTQTEEKDNTLVTYYLSRNTKIPEGASHLIVFSKNSHGEHHSPASLKVVDNLKACVNATDDDCPLGVTASGSDPEVFSVQRAKTETSVTHYVLYFGRKGCDDMGSGGTGAKNGHVSDLPVDGPTDYTLPADTPVPDGTTHVLVFSKNKYGESEVCVSASFVPKTGNQPEKTEL